MYSKNSDIYVHLCPYNKNNIAENLTLINSKSEIIEANKNNISENLTLLNSNENRLDNIENDIVNINTKATNNYNVTQINKKNIDLKLVLLIIKSLLLIQL